MVGRGLGWHEVGMDPNWSQLIWDESQYFVFFSQTNPNQEVYYNFAKHKQQNKNGNSLIWFQKGQPGTGNWIFCRRIIRHRSKIYTGHQNQLLILFCKILHKMAVPLNLDFLLRKVVNIKSVPMHWMAMSVIGVRCMLFILLKKLYYSSQHSDGYYILGWAWKT